jgi:hypothetical protein
VSFRRDDMHPVLSATRDNGAVNPEVELSADEASRVLGVSAAIVRKWCAQGEFAARRATIRVRVSGVYWQGTFMPGVTNVRNPLRKSIQRSRSLVVDL